MRIIIFSLVNRNFILHGYLQYGEMVDIVGLIAPMPFLLRFTSNPSELEYRKQKENAKEKLRTNQIIAVRFHHYRHWQS